LIRKIHTFAGLLFFIHLMIFGLVGIAAVLAPRPGGAPPAPIVTERPFRVEPGASDREIADRVCDYLHLSLARPIQTQFVIQHDPEGRLVLDFYHANGRDRVTVLAAERKLRVQTYRASVWRFLSTLHTTTAVFKSGDWRMQLWAWLNEIALWSLGVMIVTGVLQFGIRSRPPTRRVHFYTAFLTLPFLLIYWVSAVHLAHRTWLARAPLWPFLTRLHTSRGLWHSQPAWNLWVAALAILSIGLLALGVTGLVLWFRNRAERLTGAILLAAGFVTSLTLIVSMRAGP